MKSSNQNFLKSKSNFVYWHRTTLKEEQINSAISHSIAIEVDLSFDELLGTPYVGHSDKIYNNFFDRMLFGNTNKNISFENLINLLRNENLNVVFDCKDVRVLPFLEKLVYEIGTNRVAFHAFVKQWSQDKNNRRNLECIDIEEIIKFKQRTNTTWIGTSLISSYKYVNEVNLKLIKGKGQGVFHGIAFFPHYLELLLPNINVYKKISNEGFIPVFAVDLVTRKIPFNYIGLSEFINKATKISYEK